jgi:hypothetical protein
MSLLAKVLPMTIADTGKDEVTPLVVESSVVWPEDKTATSSIRHGDVDEEKKKTANLSRRAKRQSPPLANRRSTGSQCSIGRRAYRRPSMADHHFKSARMALIGNSSPKNLVMGKTRTAMRGLAHEFCVSVLL